MKREPILGEVPHDLSQRRAIKWHTYTATGKRGLFLMDLRRQSIAGVGYNSQLIDSFTPTEALELLKWLREQEAALLEAEKVNQKGREADSRPNRK